MECESRINWGYHVRFADSAMDKYKTQMRYAAQADEKAAQYLKWAADALSKH